MLLFVGRPDSQRWLGYCQLLPHCKRRLLAPRELTFLETGPLHLPSGYTRNTLQSEWGRKDGPCVFQKEAFVTKGNQEPPGTGKQSCGRWEGIFPAEGRELV